MRSLRLTEKRAGRGREWGRAWPTCCRPPPLAIDFHWSTLSSICRNRTRSRCVRSATVGVLGLSIPACFLLFLHSAKWVVLSRRQTKPRRFEPNRTSPTHPAPSPFQISSNIYQKAFCRLHRRKRVLFWIIQHHHSLRRPPHSS